MTKIKENTIGKIICAVLVLLLMAAAIVPVSAEHQEGMQNEDLSVVEGIWEEAGAEEEVEEAEDEDEINDELRDQESEEPEEIEEKGGESDEETEPLFTAAADRSGTPGVNSGVLLSEMFNFPAGSDSYVHPQNQNQAVITNDTGNQTGQMWYKYQLDLQDDFVMTSQIYLGDKSQYGNTVNGGDGLAFVLHNDQDGLEAIGAAGAGIGYGYQGASQKIDNGLVVEFDTYMNRTATDGEVHRRYNVVSGEWAGSSSSDTRYHLLHIAILEAPPLGTTKNTASGYKSTITHAAVSMYSNKEKGIKTTQDFGQNQSSGEGWTFSTYPNTAVSDIYGVWHDLTIEWDAQNYILTYKFGTPGSASYAEAYYRLDDEEHLNRVFGFQPESEKKVYWGFTGATGGNMNFQSVAIDQLPTQINAEAEKSGVWGLDWDSEGLMNSLQSGMLEGYKGSAGIFRSTVKLIGEESHVPLAEVQYEEQLDGVILYGDTVRLEWVDEAGNVTRQEEIAVENSDSFNADELNAYITSDNKLYVMGIQEVGINGQNVVTEELRITYRAVITAEAPATVNNSNGVFRSGTAESLQTNNIPVNVKAYSGNLELTKGADKTEASVGEELTYTITVSNRTDIVWRGSLIDAIPQEIEMTGSKDDIILEGSTAGIDPNSITINSSTFEIRELELLAGEEVKIIFKVELTAGEAGESVTNRAVFVSNPAMGIPYIKLEAQAQTLVTERAAGELRLVIPQVIDFGNADISPKAESYKIMNMDFGNEEKTSIGVEDTRAVKSRWTLNAYLENPLQNEAGTVAYLDALVYRSGISKIILGVGNGNSRIIASDRNEDTWNDISGNWYEGEMPSGLFLELAGGQGLLGKHKATIVWELRDVPE